MTSIPSVTAAGATPYTATMPTAPGISDTAATAATSQQAGGVAAKTLGADVNMFLKLLTTQMQNQDPLSPMDTSQYTQQLVQYSQVEQSIQQTSTLKDILARLSTQDMAQASGFIGREATFDSSVSGLTGSTNARWSFEAARPVSAMTANVIDAAGNVVSSQAIDPFQRGSFDWNGVLPTGAQAGEGPYSLAISATDSAGGTVPVTVRGTGTVSSVSSGANGLEVLVNGVLMPVTKLLRVSLTA